MTASVSKTLFVPRATVQSLKNASSNAIKLTGHHHHHAYSNIRAAVSGFSVSLKTPFTCRYPYDPGHFLANTLVKTSRRFYAADRVTATQGDVFTPPDISDYKKDVSTSDKEISNRAFSYFMIGGYSVLGVAAAKNIVTDYLVNLAASADVLALAKVEVDMGSIPEGKNVVLKWRGKPIVIRHRTADEIAEANDVNLNDLRHRQTDADRTKKPEWLVMLAVCTHLGCVPIGEAGEFGGWFCPCHGSHYDISGRIRKGPAPLNLEIPPYEFVESDTKVFHGYKDMSSIDSHWINAE